MTRRPPQGGGSEDGTKVVAARGRGTQHAQSWIAENIFGSEARHARCVSARERERIRRSQDASEPAQTDTIFFADVGSSIAGYFPWLLRL
jgi:hypothetical protein